MRRLLLIACLLVTAACSRHSQAAHDLPTFDVAEPPAAAVMMDKPAEEAEQQAALPQIAYTYTIGYRAAADAVAGLQRSHIALCGRLGPARCRIVSMSRDTGDDGAPQGALTFLVESRIARAFQDRLDSAAASSGGSVSSRGIKAEDLSKQIVDTSAKVRGKEALANRLVQLLRDRNGKVGELVEAEKAYAQTEEELDAARSWLAEMRGRVAMSRIDVSYTGVVPVSRSAWKPVGDAFSDAGQVVGASLAKLLTLLLSALPWLLFLALLIAVGRRLGWRLRLPRRRRRAAAV
jgi:hypothetical protein